MINTTLQQLPEAFKENSNKKIAEWIVKYQKFSMKAALKYAPEGFKESTLKQYMVNSLPYLRSGKKLTCTGFLTPYIDKLIQNHVQPLTPSESEKRREFTKRDFTKKDTIPPVAKLEIVQKPLIAKFLYGIRFDDTIKIFDSEEEAKGFNKGLEYAGESAGKLISVEIGEV